MPQETHVNQVAKILNKVLVDGRVGSLQAKLIFVLGFQRLQSCVCVLIFPLKVVERNQRFRKETREENMQDSHLQHFLLNHFEFLVAIEFLFRYALLDFSALHFSSSQLFLSLSTVQLIAMIGFHCCVELLKDPENLFVNLISNLAALLVNSLTIIVDCLKTLHKLRRVNIRQSGVIAG